MVNGPAGRMLFSKDGDTVLKHWGNGSGGQVHGMGLVWRQRAVLEKWQISVVEKCPHHSTRPWCTDTFTVD